MKKNLTITPPRAWIGGKNYCLECRLYFSGKCHWEPGYYCKITRSR